MTGAERMARARARMRRLVDELLAENERLRALLRRIRDGTLPPSAADEELRREGGRKTRQPNIENEPQ